MWNQLSSDPITSAQISLNARGDMRTTRRSNGESGGYLFGMLIASYFVGYFSERNFDKKYFQSLFAIFFGTLIIFIPGIIWLGFWFDNFHPKLAESIGLYEGYKLALIHGLFAFKFTEPVKVALAASITPLLWQYISKK